MREWALIGSVALLFGLGSFYATDHFGAFSVANLAIGTVALLVAAITALSRLSQLGGIYSRPVIVRGLLLITGAMALGTGLERAAQYADIRFDWTLEGSYDPAPATIDACNALEGVHATLYYDPLDPRIRRTRLLLENLARFCDLNVQEQELNEEVYETDEFGVGSSNTVVLELGDAFELVPRPTEGTLYEGFYRLRSMVGGTLTLLKGDGEGSVTSERADGFSGFGVALETEGYRLREVVSPTLEELPVPTDALIVISPKRRLPDSTLDGIRSYLAEGGRMVAMLDPGFESGLEEILASYGMESPNALVIDPQFSRPGSGGLEIIANSYETHPVAQGLNRNRMTYFPRSRAFQLRKRERSDKLTRAVLASYDSWLFSDPDKLPRDLRDLDPGDARRDYQAIVASGRYDRGGHETRIVAFGNSSFASNHHLRTLYNLDLALNAVHWVMEREPEIKIRPKIRNTIQFPLPIANTLQVLYGVGLLVPEVLLIAGGLVWLRRRNA
ncbi:GldG family protein [Myxococcota bacterium]|nr:GldG family protein [Myxococcota bacterium]